MTELVIFEEQKTDLVALFKPGGADPLLKMIKEEVAKFEPDLSSEEGRKAIASIAYKVAKAKNRLDVIGKESTEHHQNIIKQVNAERNRIFEAMQKIQDDVRKPLTDWENANEARIEGHKGVIQDVETGLENIKNNWQTMPIEQIEGFITELTTIYQVRNWEEFAYKANGVRVNAFEQAGKYHDMRLKQDADKAELERLRVAEAARIQKEREAVIAQEAADKAKKEAEEKAEKDRIAAAAKAKAEKDAIEAAAKLAEAKAEEERLASAKREKEAQERAEAAEKARIAQEQKAAKDAAEAKQKLVDQQLKAKADADAAALKAKQDAEKAAANERAKIEAQQVIEILERKKREDNKRHMAKIATEMRDDIMLLEVDKETAEQIVNLIFMKKIRHLTVNY